MKFTTTDHNIKKYVEMVVESHSLWNQTVIITHAGFKYVSLKNLYSYYVVFVVRNYFELLSYYLYVLVSNEICV